MSQLFFVLLMWWKQFNAQLVCEDMLWQFCVRQQLRISYWYLVPVLQQNLLLCLFPFHFQAVTDALGPDAHTERIGKIHLIQFDSEGVFGWIPTHGELINQFLSGDFISSIVIKEFYWWWNLSKSGACWLNPVSTSEPVELFSTRPRIRRDTAEDDDDDDAALPRLPNPIVCLSTGDMLIFSLTINHTGIAGHVYFDAGLF